MARIYGYISDNFISIPLQVEPPALYARLLPRRLQRRTEFLPHFCQRSGFLLLGVLPSAPHGANRESVRAQRPIKLDGTRSKHVAVPEAHVASVRIPGVEFGGKNVVLRVCASDRSEHRVYSGGDHPTRLRRRTQRRIKRSQRLGTLQAELRWNLLCPRVYLRRRVHSGILRAAALCPKRFQIRERLHEHHRPGLDSSVLRWHLVD